jgi:aspartyl protease family protein
MSTFTVDMTIANLSLPKRRRRVSATVDTGATYTMLPRKIIEDLGCHPIGTRRVVLGDGREEEWPITAVQVTVNGQAGPTFCLVGPPGSAALLGAVTLEGFALGVDPIAQRLIPIRSYALTPSTSAASPGRARRRRRGRGSG